MKKIVIIGSGFMGSAIAAAIREKNEYSLGILNLVDVEGAEKLAAELNAEVCTPESLSEADMIIIAFKPQNFKDASALYGQYISGSVPVVSIMAGVKTDSINKGLGGGKKIIRVMPNLAVSVGKGVCAYYCNEKVSSEDISLFEDIFGSMGITEKVDESMMSVVTALSGSGPAYFYYLCKYMIESGVKLGMDRKTAERLVRGTISGSAELSEFNKNVSFDEMLDRITSAKGTTEAALKSFDSDNAGDAIIRALEACYNRSEELSRE